MKTVELFQAEEVQTAMILQGILDQEKKTVLFCIREY